MKKTRAIRISTQEDQLIEEFLKKNPVFDFSTLARTAIIQFIQEPNLKLNSVSQSVKPKGKQYHGHA
jgi:hypothetical protein